MNIPITIVLMAVLGWVTLGYAIVHCYLPKVETSLIFYLIFNSLATIGVNNIASGGMFGLSI